MLKDSQGRDSRRVAIDTNLLPDSVIFDAYYRQYMWNIHIVTLPFFRFVLGKSLCRCFVRKSYSLAKLPSYAVSIFYMYQSKINSFNKYIAQTFQHLLKYFTFWQRTSSTLKLSNDNKIFCMKYQFPYRVQDWIVNSKSIHQLYREYIWN